MMKNVYQWVANANATAERSLAPEQRALTYASTWVCFGPTDSEMEFGRVISLDQIKTLVLEGEHLNMTEKVETALGIRNGLEAGYLYGWTYSRLRPHGQNGMTHKSRVWPITQEVMSDALASRWRYDLLPNESVAAIERVRRAMLVHMRSTP